MDLALYSRVLWRFKWIVAGGFALACLFALVATFRIGPGGISYRKAEQWVSYETLFVTQQGFPWGRSVVPNPPATPTVKPSQLYADPTRLSSLAILYSQLATGDDVRRLMLESGPIRGTIEAAPVLATQNANGDALPLISIAAFGTAPDRAIGLARRAGDALQRFIVSQENDNRIAPADRVLLTVVKRPTTAKLFQGRSMTVPIIVFVATLGAAIALAFVLENLLAQRRRNRDERPMRPEPVSRRSARRMRRTA